SDFITTYMYTPLVRSFSPISFAKSLWAIILVMALAGLWHGAAWTFVAFGLVHGLGLAVNHLWRKRKKKLPAALGWLCTFLLVNAAFVFFRARDFGAAFRMLGGMLGLQGLAPSGASLWQVLLLNPLAFEHVPLFEGLGYLDTVLGLALVPLGLGGALLLKNSAQLLEGFRPSRRAMLLLAGSLFASLVFMNSFVEKGFVYRDF
ncbi:MAG: membrane-bound O-acyltransferase family protein, partial [Desulfovibrio sp.]|nr:membrane-bound O-acyltransferase family protein [Desulfovibrio sp.]